MGNYFPFLHFSFILLKFFPHCLQLRFLFYVLSFLYWRKCEFRWFHKSLGSSLISFRGSREIKIYFEDEVALDLVALTYDLVFTLFVVLGVVTKVLTEALVFIDLRGVEPRVEK